MKSLMSMVQAMSNKQFNSNKVASISEAINNQKVTPKAQEAEVEAVARNEMALPQPKK